MSKQSILEQAKELSTEQQLELVFDLWDQFRPDEMDLPLTPELQAELDRRIKEDDEDDSPPVEWEVLREKLLRGEI